MPEAGPLEEACQPNKRPTGTVVIGWRKLAPGEAVPTKIKNPRGSVLFFSAGVATASPSARADVAGKGGSLARFAVLNQALYIVDDYSLRLYDLQNPATPVAGPRLPLGFGIETIFPQDHYLFLGTQRGMYIFDVATATAPKQLSFYSHVVSCDPVVVDGRYAYVTLRSGRTCGGGANVLEVIDLNNLSAPSLARSYPMTRPQGLGAEHNKLYVCDDGLQSFDTSQSPILKPLQHFNTTLTDVIPNGDYLLAIGPGGLYQYRINGAVLEQVSRLAITPES